ncbi:MAG: thioredoxin family protein [Bacillota bacterium]|nr:thioredoxin family protein [Bacillota bacterium]
MKYEQLSNIKIEDFDNLTYDSSVPVLVFFGAARCQVCKELLPTVEDVLKDYSDRMNSYWVDVDEYKTLATRFRLRGIPHLLLFNGGEIRDRASGLVERELLINKIENVLNEQ